MCIFSSPTLKNVREKIPQSDVVALRPLENVVVTRSRVGDHKRKTQEAKKVQQSMMVHVNVPP